MSSRKTETVLCQKRPTDENDSEDGTSKKQPRLRKENNQSIVPPRVFEKFEMLKTSGTAVQMMKISQALKSIPAKKQPRLRKENNQSIVPPRVFEKFEMEMTNSENDYAELVVVAEDEWYSRMQERTTMCIYNTLWEIKEDCKVLKNITIDRVLCRKFLPGRENCHAEVLFIADNVLADKVCKKFIIAAGEKKNDPGVAEGNDFAGSVVIRILEEKQKILKEFDDRSAADVTFVVNGEECKADRKNLASISPVFSAMLYGKFAEGNQDKITLEGIDSAGIFKDFLLAVSPLRVQPNPSNVVALLELAHQYDIPFLMRNCEDHLMRCYEIPIADRVFLAGKYGLDCLKMRIMQKLGVKDLTGILRNKGDQLHESRSEFLFDVIADRMDEMQNKLEKIQNK